MTENDSNLPVANQLNTQQLAAESLELLNKAIAETDTEKVTDLTYLFNINQNKKTMVRVNKLNDLLDVITDQAINRFTERPDNVSNQELLQGLKVVQDAIERSNKQITGTAEAKPLIQIQHNEVNVSNDETPRTKESRDNIKNAVMNILNGLGVNNAVMETPIVSDYEDKSEEH